MSALGNLDMFALAEMGYEAYRQQMLVSDQIVPTWEQLTVRERCAWQAAAGTICGTFAKAVTA